MSSPTAQRDAFLAEFEDECATTRKLIERIPDDALDWKPHEKSWSLQELATHVVNIPTWMETTLQSDGLDVAQEFPPPTTGGRDVLLEQFDANVATARAQLADAEEATLGEDWSLRAGPQTMFTLPKAVVLRRFILSHLIHHRGQLSVYMRLRNVPLPSIYGPSADEQVF